MRLVSWKDEYSVGIDSIDDEHRQLIETINRLHEELDSPDRKRTVPGFFKRLMVEIKTHFVHEEEFMREHDYTGIQRAQAGSRPAAGGTERHHGSVPALGGG